VVLRDSESWIAPPDNEDVCDRKHDSLAASESTNLQKSADSVGLFGIYHPRRSEIYFI
jgi:hypothetical protein